MPPSLAKSPTTLPSSHPSNRGGSHALPLLPQTGCLQHWGYCHGGKLRQGTLKELCLRVCFSQTPEHRHHRQPPPQNCPMQALPPPLPASPVPSTYFRREPTRGAAGGAQGPATSSPAPSAPSSSGTPRAPSRSQLGLCCAVSGPARRVRPVPGERRDWGGPHGPCPDPAAPSLLFSAAAHKIFSLTTVRARARACLGNREGENRAAPPHRSGWEGRAASCLSFPSRSRRIQVALAGGRQESSQRPTETLWSSTAGTTQGSLCLTG